MSKQDNDKLKLELASLKKELAKTKRQAQVLIGIADYLEAEKR